MGDISGCGCRLQKIQPEHGFGIAIAAHFCGGFEAAAKRRTLWPAENLAEIILA